MKMEAPEPPHFRTPDDYASWMNHFDDPANNSVPHTNGMEPYCQWKNFHAALEVFSAKVEQFVNHARDTDKR
ncbi:hypothetical protein [Caballeronia zhejiangensis]|uniref:hypothetical protein n=1 Tax=Caballeronia zhejiangensis TaxID=871203 RepID=UPI001F51CB1E|nr:hypothetical protein [Caballeronia zhejiangensis]MCI1046933.1 hypothetical protein [Caballeronia zhejiangensis]